MKLEIKIKVYKKTYFKNLFINTINKSQDRHIKLYIKSIFTIKVHR